MLGHLVYSRHDLDSGSTVQPHVGWLRRFLNWLLHH